jgi:ABC-type Mn/Zn transport systems, ATPase component
LARVEQAGTVSSEPDAAVSITDLTVSRGGVCALEAVNARVPRGQCTAVVGPNGAGKTTFILALLGELRHAGTIRISGPADPGPARIGYVPQQLHFDRGMPLTVTEFLALGLQRRPLWLGIAPSVRDRAAELLEAVQAGALSGRKLGVLSGGETQRVLLALALAQDPDLLVLDEPAAGVDPHGESLFCELLESLRARHGFTQLMVSHDLGMVSHHADHVICLNKTVIAEGAPRDVLTAPILMRLFGLHMGLLGRKGMPDGDIFCSQPCCEEHEHA